MADLSGTGKHVRILVSDTGRGLWRDAELIAGLVREKGLATHIIACPPHSDRTMKWIQRLDRVRKLSPKLLRHLLNNCQVLFFRTRRDESVLATIHLQRVYSRYVAGHHHNWLIPNAEWYQLERTPYLAMIDRVLCKTRESETTFKSLHSNVVYTGFSGLLPDMECAYGAKNFRRFLHVAGNNRKKGTAAVVRAWNQHPEWPALDLVIEDRTRLPVTPDNVRIHERVDGETLDQLRRECGVAVAPSEAEGFGHVLLDAMAWGQVVVTVDAPPMNELIGTDRGFLVGWTHSRPCRLGTQYFVDQKKLECTVCQILEMNQETLEERSDSARHWVRSNHEVFRQRMYSLLEELTYEK